MCLFKNSKLKLQNRIANLERDVNMLSADNDGMRKLIVELKSELATTQNKLVETIKKYNDIFAYKEQLLNDSLTLNSTIKKLTEEKTSLEEQVTKLNQKVKSLNSKITKEKSTKTKKKTEETK